MIWNEFCYLSRWYLDFWCISVFNLCSRTRNKASTRVRLRRSIWQGTRVLESLPAAPTVRRCISRRCRTNSIITPRSCTSRCIRLEPLTITWLMITTGCPDYYYQSIISAACARVVLFTYSWDSSFFRPVRFYY